MQRMPESPKNKAAARITIVTNSPQQAPKHPLVPARTTGIRKRITRLEDDPRPSSSPHQQPPQEADPQARQSKSVIFHPSTRLLPTRVDSTTTTTTSSTKVTMPAASPASHLLLLLQQQQETAAAEQPGNNDPKPCSSSSKLLAPMAEWAKLFAKGCGDGGESDTLSETDSYCSDEDDFTDDEDSDAETAVAQALVRAAFASRAQSASSSSLESAPSSLQHLTMSSSSSLEQLHKKPRLMPLQNKNEEQDNTELHEQHHLRPSVSEPSFVLRHKEPKSQEPRAHPSSTSSSVPISANNDDVASCSPDECLRDLLLGNSTTTARTLQYVTAKSLLAQGDFFQPLCPEAIQAYDLPLVQAVRRQDVDTLRRWHVQEGRRLDAGNAYGETVLHAAARRGSTSVVRFLLHECRDVPVRVCCDYGRTVLHDACWNAAPNWECLDLILDACPDLLYVRDHRGTTPMEYVPRSLHDDWCRFLQRRGAARLRPRLLLSAVVAEEGEAEGADSGGKSSETAS